MRKLINRIIIVLSVSLIFTACSKVEEEQQPQCEPELLDCTINEEDVIQYCAETFHRES